MLTMRGGSQAGNNGVKMTRPPPVPPRPDRSLVADALARSRKVPAPVLPPGLRKEPALEAAESTPSRISPKPNTEKLPSPKLNGLSRVKSFIRDVMHEKKNTDDKRNSKDKDENVNNKNGVVKSQIPIPQLPKTKNSDPLSMNYPQEESVKNQSSQSVVRSLCSVLMNSDKDKMARLEPESAEKMRVIKSNSFAEKAVPVRRAPPPPVSPKPTKKQIELKMARSQGATDNISLRKLSVSCEELNNSSSRPVVYQSVAPSKLSSPIFLKKCIPPSLPSGKPIPPKKKIAPDPAAIHTPARKEKSISEEKLSNAEETKLPSEDNVVNLDFCDDDKKCLTEKLISEIISAKNDALLLKYTNNKLANDREIVTDSFVKNSVKHSTNGEAPVSTTKNVSTDEYKVTSCNDEQVNFVNVSYNNNDLKPHHDSVSSCGSDSSGTGAGKTILFVNSDTSLTSDSIAPDEIPVFHSVQNISTKPNASVSHKNRLNDIANHELLIAELQGMRREAFEDRVNKRQRHPSADLGSSSPDSISAETQNIQHSDWVQVEDNGRQVRYSSCQIVIEDPSSPVDDSGICLDDNFYSTDTSYSLSPSLVSRLKEQYYANLKMSSLQGLPPLPKSLSGFNVAEGGPGQPPSGQPPPPPVPARTPASMRYSQARPPGAEPPALNGDAHRQVRKPTTLDTQLAVLKREMLGLRQLDLSLLSQLWSLNESIHEFRQYMGGPGGPGGGPGGPEDLEDEGDDSSSGGEDPRPPPQRGRTPI